MECEAAALMLLNAIPLDIRSKIRKFYAILARMVELADTPDSVRHGGLVLATAYRFNPPKAVRRGEAPSTCSAKGSMYIVYVIESDEGFRYTGMTEDLLRRLAEHNDGSLSFWTKRGSNWKIVHSEEFGSKFDAAKREKWLKSGIGRKFFED